MNTPFNYITYGSRCNSREVERLLRHLLDRAFASEGKDLPTPVCIWGAHGIGKTQLVRELAGSLHAHFAYLAPAQFEEMGDLIGLPALEEDEGMKVSRFAPPDWAPREKGPGILLIDDVNRADDRILRGIMQLLQNHALASWQLPENWQIILTANPDGGDYSVTPMDDAMITRMLHVTMEWDTDSWVQWAEKAKIDERGIQFVLHYPEMVTGERTTPRTLVQFFRQIESMPDLMKQLPLVQMLADACLDEETGAAFISFIRRQYDQLIAPQAILNTGDFAEIQEKLEKLIQGEVMRLDTLALLVNRFKRILKQERALSSAQIQNLQQFLLLDILPDDLRFQLTRFLSSEDHPALEKLMQDPRISELLLKGI